MVENSCSEQIKLKDMTYCRALVSADSFVPYAVAICAYSSSVRAIVSRHPIVLTSCGLPGSETCRQSKIIFFVVALLCRSVLSCRQAVNYQIHNCADSDESRRPSSIESLWSFSCCRIMAVLCTGTLSATRFLRSGSDEAKQENR